MQLPGLLGFVSMSRIYRQDAGGNNPAKKVALTSHHPAIMTINSAKKAALTQH